MSQVETADYGLTAQAFDADAGRYKNDDTLHVKFSVHPRIHPTKSEEAGRPIFEDTHYIMIMQPGNKDNIVHRPATERDKKRFAEKYKKFLAREDQEAVEGTLLEEWPGITRSQVEELKYMHIRTVEQLAAVSDANSQNIMGIQMLKAKAVKFLDAADSNKAAEIQQKNEETIAALTARLLALEVDVPAGATELPPEASISAQKAPLITPTVVQNEGLVGATAREIANPVTDEVDEVDEIEAIEPAPVDAPTKTTRRSRKA
jgi:hypothetical protein